MSLKKNFKDSKKNIDLNCTSYNITEKFQFLWLRFPFPVVFKDLIFFKISGSNLVNNKHSENEDNIINRGDRTFQTQHLIYWKVKCITECGKSLHI